MVQSKKLNNNIVAVSWEPTEIYLRPSGKSFFGQEECLLSLSDDGRLIINTDVAEAYNISVDYVNDAEYHIERYARLYAGYFNHSRNADEECTVEDIYYILTHLYHADITQEDAYRILDYITSNNLI